MLLALLSLGACKKSDPASLPDASADADPSVNDATSLQEDATQGAPGDAQSDGGAPMSSSADAATETGTGDIPWPPPYLLYFHEVEGEDLRGLTVTSTHVYWITATGHGYRAPKDGSGQPEHLFACGYACDPNHLYADGDDVYFLQLTEVRRLDGQTLESSYVPLEYSHSGGALLVEDKYLYTAVRGCPAITRIDKETLESETMLIDGIEYPDRGRQMLVVAGETLVCAGPDSIYVIKEWAASDSAYTLGDPEGPVAKLADVGDLYGAVVHDETVFWLEDPGTGVGVGYIPLSGGTPIVMGQDRQGTQGWLVHAPSIGKLLTFVSGGIRGFDTAAKEFDIFLDLEPTSLAFRGLALDGEYLYATVRGLRLMGTSGNWIAKIPLSDILEKGQQ